MLALVICSNSWFFKSIESRLSFRETVEWRTNYQPHFLKTEVKNRWSDRLHCNKTTKTTLRIYDYALHVTWKSTNRPKTAKKFSAFCDTTKLCNYYLQKSCYETIVSCILQSIRFIKRISSLKNDKTNCSAYILLAELSYAYR